MNIQFYKPLVIRYSLLCLISFSLFFTLLIPAKKIINSLNLHDKIAPWQIHAIQGNLWQGQLNLKNNQHLSVNINWDINVLKLFSNQAVLSLNAVSEQSQLTLYSDFNGLTPALTVSGSLNPQQLSQKINLPQKISMTGQLTIKQLQLINLPPYYIQSGDITWQGGRLSAARKHYRLPALTLTLQQQESLYLHIIEQKSQLSLIDIIAHPNKKADIKIKQQLLTLTHQGELSEQASDVVIRFTETLKF